MKRAFWRVIEYFAEDKLESGFALQRSAFKFMGCFWWKKPGLLKRIYTVLFVVVQLSTLVTVTSFVINKKVKTVEDFTQVINSFIVLLAYTSAIVRWLIINWNSQYFVEMIEFLEGLPPDGVIVPGKKKIILHSVLILTTLGGWLLYGTLTTGWPWNADFPWDKNTMTGHILGLTLQVASAYPGGGTNFMIDTVIVAATEKVIPHIKKLKYALSKIGPNPDDNKILAKDAVVLHAAIIRGVYLINKAFSTMLLFQMIFFVPFICINAFVITQISDVRYTITSVLPMSLAVCMELYMFCGAGQLLTTETESLDRECYNSEWYRAPVNNRKDLSIIMECSRKPLTLNAFGVVTANNATLLAVLQQGYSYFLFLHTMADAIESY